MKNVLNHMTICQLGKGCSVPHCYSSRKIISHWKNCIRADCPVCSPLRQAWKDSNAANGVIYSAEPSAEPQLGAAPPEQLRLTPELSIADPEKLKVLQQKLPLLWHAYKCQRMENQSKDEQCPTNKCKEANCESMKNVISHMMTCEAGPACSIPDCFSSRQIISHWMECTRTNCSLCSHQLYTNLQLLFSNMSLG